MTAVEGPCACSGPHFHSVVHDCCAENADLRARLAEVEADLKRERLINRGNGESAAWINTHRMLSNERARAEAAEARLAAVLALCDQQPNETPCSCDPAYTERGLIAPGCAWHQDIESFVADVIAAVRGERDRPAAEHVGEGEYAEPPCEYTPRECPYGSDCPDHCPPRWDHPIRYPDATHNGEGAQ